MRDYIPVSGRRGFIDGPVIRFRAPKEATIAEIVAMAPGLPDYFFDLGIVKVNGREVPREMWGRVRVRTDGAIPITVTLHHPVPSGGGTGGRKNTFLTLGAIALVAGAALISGGLLGPAAAGTIGTGLLGTSFAAGGFGASLAGAGLGLAGTLLLGSIAPPAIKPDKSSDQLSVAGISGNPVTRGDFLPAVLGYFRMSPPWAFAPYLTLDDGIVTAHGVAWLAAGPYDISALLLNGASPDEIPNTITETRPGRLDDAPLSICMETRLQEAPNQSLTNFRLELRTSKNDDLVHQDDPDSDLPQPLIFRTRGSADEAEIWATFFAGILSTSDNAQAVVPVRVEFREYGTSTWKKGPVLHFTDLRLGKNFRQRIRLIWDTLRGDQQISPYSVERQAFAAFYKTGTGQSFEYAAESYFQGVSYSTQIPLMTSATTSGVTMSASSENGSNNAWKAADSSGTSTQWRANAAASVGSPQWLKVDFGASPKTIASYMIAPELGAGTGVPTDWTFEGSNDNTNWDILDTIKGASPTTQDPPFTSVNSGYFQVYKGKQASYRYYRWNITKTLDDVAPRIGTVILSTVDQIGYPGVPGYNLARNVVGTDDGFDIYLDPATFPKGEYEIKIQRGLAFRRADFSFDGSGNYQWNSNSANANFFEYTTNSVGIKEVRIGQSTFQSDIAIELFSTFRDEAPIDVTGKGIALIAIETQGNKIDSFSALFKTMIPKWNGSIWTEPQIDNNPASLLRRVQLDEVNNARALPAEIVDDENLSDFFEKCDALGYVCNAGIQGLLIGQVRNMIAAAGRAGPRQSDYWGVVTDHDRSGDDIVQVFTPLDYRNSKNRMNTDDLPHAIRAVWFDEDDDFKQKEEIVYATFAGYTAANAKDIRALDADGHTTLADVQDRMTRYLKELYFRRMEYSFEIGFSGLMANRGDLVGYTSDLISRYHNFGVVEEVYRSGDTVTGFKLEAPVDLSIAAGEVLEDMGVAMQLANRTVYTRGIVEKTLTDTITLTSSFPDIAADPLFVPGLSVGIGLLGSETKRCVVFAVNYVDALFRKVILRDEAPLIYS